MGNADTFLLQPSPREPSTGKQHRLHGHAMARQGAKELPEQHSSGSRSRSKVRGSMVHVPAARRRLSEEEKP
ncbi:hypothetical protein AV530_002019 [Patagioenas fasciata monilis]|uniref:Uncharacterized protein n=1 Tax=Patagioenas fasciata monilis TaxID=372326 RepID=A0A1V4J6E6_PATFA|nr:hypothetical protein AV530_002019 [Patagioenas fasciata monilis]